MFDFAQSARDPSRLYLLDPETGGVVKCDDPQSWDHVMRHTDQRIRVTRVAKHVVVTGFTGHDDREPGDDGDPVLFVTVIEPDGVFRSYRSADGARAGHEEIVEELADKLDAQPNEIDLNPPREEGDPK